MSTPCPKCGGKSKVLWKTKKPERDRRRRECKGCGFRWSTLEFIIQETVKDEWGMKMEMTDVQLKAAISEEGWATIWAVDDKGRHLHTEPVCSVPVMYHQWFIDWICGPDMEPPIKMPALLEDS